MKQLTLIMNFALNWVLGAMGYIVFELGLSGSLFASGGDMLLIAFLVGIATAAVLSFGLRLSLITNKGFEQIIGFYAIALMVLVAVKVIQGQL